MWQGLQHAERARYAAQHAQVVFFELLGALGWEPQGLLAMRAAAAACKGYQEGCKVGMHGAVSDFAQPRINLVFAPHPPTLAPAPSAPPADVHIASCLRRARCRRCPRPSTLLQVLSRNSLLEMHDLLPHLDAQLVQRAAAAAAGAEVPVVGGAAAATRLLEQLLLADAGPPPPPPPAAAATPAARRVAAMVAQAVAARVVDVGSAWAATAPPRPPPAKAATTPPLTKPRGKAPEGEDGRGDATTLLAPHLRRALPAR